LAWKVFRSNQNATHFLSRLAAGICEQKSILQSRSTRFFIK
jgi:hypothetical protein